MQKYGVIYKITNKQNGKCYIGQTKNSFKERYYHSGKGIERVYKYHKSLKDKNKLYNKHLLSSIEKYGFDSFKVDEELDIAYSAKELDEKEIYYIKKFGSFNNGYNNNIGGFGCHGLFGEKNSFYGKHHSKETIEYLRKINLGKKASEESKKKMSLNNGRYFKGKKKSEETKKKISETRKKNGLSKGEKNPMYGVHLTSYWKGKKITKSLIDKRNESFKKNGKLKGKNNPSAKKVICITTGKVFDTMKEASEFYNCGVSGICSCCKGNLKYSGKYNGEKLIWKYKEDN